MTKEIVKSVDETQDAIEKCLLEGDLSELSLDQRLSYYKQVCETVGLNPLTKPFQYIVLNGKLTMYALKGATDQLRRIYDISCEVKNTEKIEDLYIVTVKATNNRSGRVDEDMGFAKIHGLKGEMLGNAMLKATTKAKRRVTLSMCGLGMLDEDEVASIPDDQGTGKGKKDFNAPELKGTEKLEATLTNKEDEQEISLMSEDPVDKVPLEDSRVTFEQAQSMLDEAFAKSDDEDIYNRTINHLNDIKYESTAEDIEVLTRFAQHDDNKSNRELFHNVTKENGDKWKENMDAEDWNRLVSYMRELDKFFDMSVQEVA